MFDPFVFPAGAFPIARRTKDAFTKKTTLLRLERPIVDRFGILDFALAPGTDGVMRCHTDPTWSNPTERSSPKISRRFVSFIFTAVRVAEKVKTLEDRKPRSLWFVSLNLRYRTTLRTIPPAFAGEPQRC